MDAFAVEEARQRLTRWIEDSQSVLGVVPWLFDEHEPGGQDEHEVDEARFQCVHATCGIYFA